MKPNDTFKKMLPYQSEFSHYCASWARNHDGWAKMKKFNRRLTKHRMKQALDKQTEDEL